MSKDQMGSGGGSPRYGSAYGGYGSAQNTGSKKMPDDVLFAVVELLKVKGDARAVSVLLNSSVWVLWEKTDNWNGGLYDVSVRVLMDLRTFGRLTDDEREELRTAISSTAEQVLPCRENDSYTGVSIVPHGNPREGWREEAGAWVRGDGVNNQGRVRSDNIAACEHDGLLFRSQPEIYLYKALKARGLTFAPLPVFIRGGTSYRRLEPDFLVIKDGYVFQVEVDGDNWHKESPVDAQSRIALMEYEGVRVRRFEASEVDTEDKANGAVNRLLKWIDKEKNNRR